MEHFDLDSFASQRYAGLILWQAFRCPDSFTLACLTGDEAKAPGQRPSGSHSFDFESYEASNGQVYFAVPADRKCLRAFYLPRFDKRRIADKQENGFTRPGCVLERELTKLKRD